MCRETLISADNKKSIDEREKEKVDLPMKERVDLMLTRDCVRQEFIDEELRALRYYIIPAVDCHKELVEDYQKDVKEWRNEWASHKLLGITIMWDDFLFLDCIASLTTPDGCCCGLEMHGAYHCTACGGQSAPAGVHPHRIPGAPPPSKTPRQNWRPAGSIFRSNAPAHFGRQRPQPGAKPGTEKKQHAFPPEPRPTSKKKGNILPFPRHMWEAPGVPTDHIPDFDAITDMVRRCRKREKPRVIVTKETQYFNITSCVLSH